MEKGQETNIDWDIRFFRRYPKETDVMLHFPGGNLRARTVDYSVIGVGIVMDNVAAPLRWGDVISFDVNALDLHESGKVAWVRKTSSGLRVGILRIKPFRGSFRRYPLSDILIGLQRTVKTGILDVRHGSVHKKIYIRAGNIISASSNYEKDRLGDVLLKSRRIDRKQYDMAAEIKQKSGGRYTAILVHMGYLKPHDVIRAAELQARRITGSLFAMKDAEFEFIEGPLPSREAITLRLSLADFIYRTLRKNADVDLLEHYLLDSIVDFSSNPLNLFQNIRFTAADRAVISRIDGRTTIRDILRLSPTGRINPLKIVYALLEARFLKIKEKHELPSGIRAGEILGTGEKGICPPGDEIDRLYSECGNLDPYRILGVERTAAPDEIRKAYYRAARKYHPDMHVNMPEAAKKKLIEIFTHITDACLTLTDPAKRQEYDHLAARKDVQNAPSATQEEREQKVDVAQPDSTISSGKAKDISRLRFRDGKVAFWDEKYDDAARLFAAAISSGGSAPEYHYYYGAALGMLGRLKEAVQALNRANELKPLDADILAELGHVYLKLKFPVRAKGYFERAVKLAPSNVRAREGLELMRGRKPH